MGPACPLAMKPGDDLLFHRLGDSTIGAVRFHGRVRDGIGWVTDAMVTKLQGERSSCFLEIVHNHLLRQRLPTFPDPRMKRGSAKPRLAKAVVDGGIHQARTEQLGPVSSTRYRASTSGLS